MPNLKTAVIGGGVAGLCAANRLLDLGNTVHLYDAGRLLQPRVCGEFLSSESLPALANWGIVPEQKIEEVVLHRGNRSFSLSLSNPARSVRRQVLESELLDRGRSLGLRVLENTPVESIQSCRLMVAGQSEQYDRVIVSAGRIFGKRVAAPKWKGRKAYFRSSALGSTLHMNYLQSGGYVGMSQVDADTVNVTALLKDNGELPEELLRRYGLGDRVSDWIESSVPGFGSQMRSVGEQVYLVGDAAGAIPPITGNGLTLSIHSAIQAAEFADFGELEGYQTFWRSAVAPAIYWGKLLHNLSVLPVLSVPFFAVGATFPAFSRYLYEKTRYKSLVIK